MKKTTSIFFLSLFLLCFVGVVAVHAQPKDSNANPTIVDSNSVTEINFPNPFKNKGIDNLFDLVKAIVNNIILPVGGVLCVLAFIYAGFMYVMAQGKPAALEEANRTLLHAAIGTAVLLGAWVLANTVCGTVHLLGGPACNIQ